MNPVVRLAKNSDIPDLQELDPWPKDTVWRQKILNQEVIALELSKQVIGLVRYSVLWTTVPFIGLISIKQEYRKQGYSIKLLDFLKQHLRDQGFIVLLSSSQTNEPEPQAWHHHMGFVTNGIIENIADDNIGEIVYRLML